MAFERMQERIHVLRERLKQRFNVREYDELQRLEAEEAAAAVPPPSPPPPDHSTPAHRSTRRGESPEAP